jgi:hypothetical protein
MFALRFFAAHWFPPHYFAEVGAAIVVLPAGPTPAIRTYVVKVPATGIVVEM